jgi:hypothetical protein
VTSTEDPDKPPMSWTGCLVWGAGLVLAVVIWGLFVIWVWYWLEQR